MALEQIFEEEEIYLGSEPIVVAAVYYSQRFDVLESKTETMDGRYSKPACFRPSSPEQISPSRSLF